MIDPNVITTVNVGGLPPADFNLTDNLPHEIGTELFRGTVQQLADLIGAYLGTSDSLAFNPTTVVDGGTLPATTSNEWMLVGKGTFTNVGGGSDIVTTEELNAITSNGSYWSLAVQIPINVELAGITQNIRSGYTQTVPSEDAVYNAIANILNTISNINSDNISNNSSVDGATVSQALENINETAVNNKVFQDIVTFSAFSGLGLNKANSSIVAIGDSNLEGYNTVNVGSGNWFNITAKAIQKYQGAESGIGFTNLSDLTRYGVTKTGTATVVSSGPTNTALQMTPGSTLEFTSATNFVEFWMNMGASSGKIELYYNNVLYRTIDAYNATTINNQYTFNGTATPSVVSGNYKLKCINANVVVTALFTKVLFSNPFDSYFFLRDGVSAKSFANFNVANIKATRGLGGSSTNNVLYLLNLGTNSIYNVSTGTTSTQYGIDLTNYINGLRDVGSNVVYIMPPRALETLYPPAVEPYMNYYTVAIAVCKALGVEMIDLNDLNLYGTLSTFFEADGLHYSTAGHAMIANIVINSLAKINVNSRNLLYQYQLDYPVPVMTGTTHYLPKRTGTNTYGNSGVYDNGTEIATDKTTRIPANIGFQWGTPTSTNFIQAYFDGTSKELKFTNSTGGVFMTLKESNGRVTFGSNITIPDGLLSTDAVNKGQLDTLRPYKVYTALIFQSGTSDPTATVLENTLGGTVTFSRVSTGSYLATLTGAFTVNKTACFITATTGTFVHQAVRSTSNDVAIVSLNSSNSATDSLLSNTTLEIRVYN